MSEKDNAPMLSQGHKRNGDEPMLGGDRRIEVVNPRMGLDQLDATRYAIYKLFAATGKQYDDREIDEEVTDLDDA